MNLSIQDCPRESKMGSSHHLTWLCRIHRRHTVLRIHSQKGTIWCLFLEPVKCQKQGASSAAKKRLIVVLFPTHAKPAVSAGLSRFVTRCVLRLLKSWEADKPKPLRGSLYPGKYKAEKSLRSIDCSAHFDGARG